MSSSTIVVSHQALFFGRSDALQFLPYVPLLPPVILWNPEVQFPLFFSQGMICPECSAISKVKKWN